MAHQTSTARASVTWFDPQSKEEQEKKEDDESSSDETPDEVEIL